MFSDREWFSVVVKPGRNQEVHERLQAQGYGSFAPMCLRERKHGPGRIETVRKGLFERYQFVGLTTEQPFRPIESTIGVSFVVRGVGHFPLRVSPLVLRRVKARCDADGGAVDFRPRRPAAPPRMDWTPQQALEVIDGPFANFAATLLELDKRHEMALVLVNIFGRETRIGIPTAGLRPMGLEAQAA